MEKYIIYCTPVQTKKALELGAPIRYKDTLDNRERGKFETPTAEQMIGWFEEQKIIHNINIIGNDYDCDWKYEIYLNMPDGYDYIGREDYQSRKEATLAAIDKALEYLKEQKEKR